MVDGKRSMLDLDQRRLNSRPKSSVFSASHRIANLASDDLSLRANYYLQGIATGRTTPRAPRVRSAGRPGNRPPLRGAGASRRRYELRFRYDLEARTYPTAPARGAGAPPVPGVPPGTIRFSRRLEGSVSAAGRCKIELSNREAEEEVVDEEVDQADRYQHPTVVPSL